MVVCCWAPLTSSSPSFYTKATNSNTFLSAAPSVSSYIISSEHLSSWHDDDVYTEDVLKIPSGRGPRTREQMMWEFFVANFAHNMVRNCGGQCARGRLQLMEMLTYFLVDALTRHDHSTLGDYKKNYTLSTDGHAIKSGKFVIWMWYVLFSLADYTANYYLALAFASTVVH